jgi:hypothetical protein
MCCRKIRLFVVDVWRGIPTRNAQKREMNQVQHCNNHHRRIFRGRAGPTDRQLPPFNAARRKPTTTTTVSGGVVGVGTATTSTRVDPNSIYDRNTATVHDDSNTMDDEMEVYELQIIDPFVVPVVDEITETDGVVPNTISSNSGATAASNHLGMIEQDIGSSSNTLDNEMPYRKEVQHLLRRIRNNRTAWSTSSAIGLMNADVYQTNVLSASLNTIQEWRSIRRYYNDADDFNMDAKEDHIVVVHTNPQTAMDDSTKKLIGLEIFQLIQHSIQCGPMSGSQPGYFKRCGNIVAQMVHQYLQQAVRDTTTDDATHTLYMTPAQANIIEVWKKNAYKAVLADQAPSKSVLRQQSRAQGIQAKKKKK